MLDIILSTRVFDLGLLYEFGDLNSDIMTLYHNGKSDFVSMYEKKEKKALKMIDKINAYFAGEE